MGWRPILCHMRQGGGSEPRAKLVAEFGAAVAGMDDRRQRPSDELPGGPGRTQAQDSRTLAVGSAAISAVLGLERCTVLRCTYLRTY